MRLHPFPPYCKGQHRSGWPFVHEALSRVADGTGPLLDDFVDASFGYRPVRTAYSEPWVGIVHHPAKIESPLAADVRWQVARHLQRHRLWRYSRPNLRGVVCMAPGLAELLHKWLRVPVLLLKHPTGTARTWEPAARRCLWQVGFFLRDTQFVHQMPELKPWRRARTSPLALRWAAMRDAKLRRARTQRAVDDVPRLDAEAYDERMARGVCMTKLFGAAANNVVVECMARDTPLLVNRLPEVEWYLGQEYPLFFDSQDLDQAARNVYDEKRVLAAHEYLRDRDHSWMDADAFAAQVLDFVEGCCP